MPGRKGTNKWGKLEEKEEEEQKGVFKNNRRKVRVIPDESYDSDGETFSLEEYQEYMTITKPGYNNNNNNNNNKTTLTPEKILSLKKVQFKNSGQAKNISTAIAFEKAVKNRDIETIKYLSDCVFGRSYNSNVSPDVEYRIVASMLSIYDLQLYDILFLRHYFRFDSAVQVSNVVLEIYRASISQEKRSHFLNIVNYFLDMGCFGTVSMLIGELMVQRNDTELMDAFLGHDASYLSLVSGHYYIQKLIEFGDSSAPVLEKVLKEMTKDKINKKVYNSNYISTTILNIAASNNCLEIVKILLSCKADPTILQEGKYAEQLATNEDIKAVLREATKDKVEGISHIALGEVSRKAIKRIMRDWQEVMDDPPSDSVRAFPNENNMFEWHIVLTPPATDHPLSGLNFHFIMTFPKNYPEMPPKIIGSQFLPHPNYYTSFICLNMLRDPSCGSYSSWSSGYSALSILMQLQSFLFADSAEQDYGGIAEIEINKADYVRSCLSSIRFSCKHCGFNHSWRGVEYDVPFDKFEISYLDKEALTIKMDKIKSLPLMGPPAYGQYEESERASIPSSSKKNKTNFLSLNDDAIVGIMDFLVRMEDLYPVFRVCRRFKQIGEKYSVITRRELTCFHSKVNFNTDVLGVGVQVTRTPSGNVKSLSSSLDLLSRESFFVDQVRSSVWREGFDYWLPLVINEKHAERSLPMLQATIVAILMNVSFEVGHEERELRNQDMLALDANKSEARLIMLASKFQPLMVLDVIPKLMNSTVVAMMKSDSENGAVALHHSEKALLGYCYYHHILLEMCRRYPEIQHKIDNVLEQFMRHESARVKLAQPDLGELLVYLSVASKVTWNNIAPAFVQELLERNVVWVLDPATGKGHSELAYLETEEVSEYRLNTTLEASLTGLRLLMFQVFFLAKVGRPTGHTSATILKRLNSSYGTPPAGIPYLLQKECEQIYHVKSWPKFFEKIGLSCPSKPQMTNILRQAIKNSEHKGYHIKGMSEKTLFDMRKKVDKDFKLKHKEYIPTVEIPETIENTQNTEHAEKSANNNAVKLYVGNLSYRVTALDLEYVFKQFGKLVSATVSCDPEGKSRGFGFIEVENDAIATTLVEFMQGADVDRRPVRLERIDKNRPNKPRNTIQQKTKPLQVAKPILKSQVSQPKAAKAKNSALKQNKSSQSCNPFAGLDDTL